MSRKSFIKQFWKEHKMVGSMVPSSRFLAKKMLNPIDFQSARVIVELGPGSGVFTRRIQEEMSQDAHLLVFELNDEFFELLNKEFQDPRVHIIHDSAENIGQYLEKLNLTEADVVMSSLPLTNFPSVLKTKILSESHRILKENGLFVQFQYSLNAKKVIKSFFPNINITFTPANFPPAFVYTCRK